MQKNKVLYSTHLPSFTPGTVPQEFFHTFASN